MLIVTLFVYMLFVVFVSDCAFVVNGIALICNPARGKRKLEADTIKTVLRKEVGVTVEDLNTKKAFINGSDILFTGTEFFVGEGVETNTEGALNVANTWPEYPSTPVQVDIKTIYFVTKGYNLDGW